MTQPLPSGSFKHFGMESDPESEEFQTLGTFIINTAKDEDTSDLSILIHSIGTSVRRAVLLPPPPPPLLLLLLLLLLQLSTPERLQAPGLNHWSSAVMSWFQAFASFANAACAATPRASTSPTACAKWAWPS